MHVVALAAGAGMSRREEAALAIGPSALSRHWQVLVTRMLAHALEVLRSNCKDFH